MSPSFRVAEVMRTPLTNVPLDEERSRSRNCSPSKWSSAWWAETDGWATTRSLSEARPTVRPGCLEAAIAGAD